MKNCVSVIIPSYGNNTDLCRAVDSVIHQDYPNIEVIIVDDNGADSKQQELNAALLKKYDGDSRVHYLVHIKNMGGSAARNTGARAAIGDYLCFLDDDDELADPTKISKQMEVAVLLGPDWAGTYSSMNIFNNGRLSRKVVATRSGWILEDYMNGSVEFQTTAPIITRSSFEAIGGFEESFKRHQDWEFFSRLLDRYMLKAVPHAFFNRYYENETRKPAEVRLEYMDKYVSYMRLTIKSIPNSKLGQILKRKYISVILAFLREGRVNRAIDICKENGYSLVDCFLVIREVGKHSVYKLLG